MTAVMAKQLGNLGVAGMRRPCQGRSMEIQPRNHFLLSEQDEELRAIVATEMQRALKMPVESCGPQDRCLPELLQNAVPVCLPNRAKALSTILPSGTELTALRVSSVPKSLAAYLPLPASILIGIASRAPDFLKLARTMLVAAGLDADALVIRDARRSNWIKGLDQTAAVMCDSITATTLLKGCRAIPFPLLSEASLNELREYGRSTNGNRQKSSYDSAVAISPIFFRAATRRSTHTNNKYATTPSGGTASDHAPTACTATTQSTFSACQ